MIQLITQIKGEVFGNYIDPVQYVSSISGEIQREDYINLNGFIAITQNLSRVEFTSVLDVPYYFGLTNQSNKAFVTLEINY
jgi:hypothetical protein